MNRASSLSHMVVMEPLFIGAAVMDEQDRIQGAGPQGASVGRIFCGQGVKVHGT